MNRQVPHPEPPPPLPISTRARDPRSTPVPTNFRQPLSVTRPSRRQAEMVSCGLRRAVAGAFSRPRPLISVQIGGRPGVQCFPEFKASTRRAGASRSSWPCGTKTDAGRSAVGGPSHLGASPDWDLASRTGGLLTANRPGTRRGSASSGRVSSGPSAGSVGPPSVLLARIAADDGAWT